jgi:amphi-Trp domain-containing protein
MKRPKFRHADQRTVQACIEQLRALIDGLEAGTISLQQEGDPEEVQLRPGGAIDFEIRVEQLKRRESIRLDMTWRTEPERTDEDEDSLVERGGPLSTRAVEGVATGRFREIYTAARTLGCDGRWHIDQDRLLASLDRAGIDPLAQQELYTLALLADADARMKMFSERARDALERASERPPPRYD